MHSLRTIIPLSSRRSAAPAPRYSEFDRLFDSFFSNALSGIGAAMPSAAGLSLSLDISETDTAYQVVAELPGLSENDVEVTVNDGVLTIEGRKMQEETEEGKTWHRTERLYGAFKRTLVLPQDADEASLEATLKNGLLTVQIGKSKTEEKKAKRIAVKGA